MDFDETLADMAARRVEALRAQMASTLALALLAETGSVHSVMLAAELERRFVAPDEATIAAMLAAKTAAALDVHERALASASDAVAGAQEKVRKLLVLVDAARGDVAEAERQRAAAEQARDDARGLAEHAAARAKAAPSASPGAPVAVNADAASAQGGA
jgi:hypothetical protein